MSMEQEQEQEQQPQSQTTDALPLDSISEYFIEFDQACNIVAQGGTLDFIEDETTREACFVLCNITNLIRMQYAVIRNNSEFRLQKQVGPDAFTTEMPGT